MLISLDFRASVCMMELVEHCKKPRCPKIGTNRIFFKFSVLKYHEHTLKDDIK